MLSLIFISTSLSLSLPQGLLESVCYIESKHRISAIHRHDGHGNSYGICQIKYSTAQSLGFTGTAEELMRPEVNIYYAGLYLKQQITRYHSTQRGVIAYNYGNAKSLTTTKYQRIVFKEWFNLERIAAAFVVADILVDAPMRGQQCRRQASRSEILRYQLILRNEKNTRSSQAY